MKKLILISLAIALILTAASACGNDNQNPNADPSKPATNLTLTPDNQDNQDNQGTQSNQSNQGTQSTTAINIRTKETVTLDARDSAWPSAQLPAGFPVYPNATVIISEQEEDGYYVQVTGTDMATFKEYVSTVKSTGWVLEEDWTEDIAIGWQGSTYVIIVIDQTDVGIFVGQLEFEIFDWPTDKLPAGFPQFPGGDVTAVDEETDYVFVTISNAGRGAYNAYIETLKAAGWNFDQFEESNAEQYMGYEDAVSASKDNHMLTLMIDAAGEVIFMVNTFDFDLNFDLGIDLDLDDLDGLDFEP